MILVCKSGDFASYFPDNTSADFKNNLPRREAFTHDAKITLLEAHIPASKKVQKAQILCNAVSHTAIGAAQRRLLRVIHIPKSEEDQKLEFTPQIAVDVSCRELFELQFSIATFDNKPVEFPAKSETILVLEIK
jgi:hypothetical protein